MADGVFEDAQSFGVGQAGDLATGRDARRVVVKELAKGARALEAFVQGDARDEVIESDFDKVVRLDLFEECAHAANAEADAGAGQGRGEAGDLKVGHLCSPLGRKCVDGRGFDRQGGNLAIGG